MLQYICNRYVAITVARKIIINYGFKMCTEVCKLQGIAKLMDE